MAIKWVLFNCNYGVFKFSNEFIATFNTLYPGSKALHDCVYSDSPRARSNDDVIEAVRAFGIERSSKTPGDFKMFPVYEGLLSCARIHEYDGSESVVLQPTVLYAKLLHEYMESQNTDLSALRTRYDSLTELVKQQEELEQNYYNEIKAS
jgi:hypothetical protein